MNIDKHASTRIAKIECSDRQGTASFVGRRTLLTCAHAVGARNSKCTVTFGQNTFNATVLERLAFESEHESDVRYPDIALVEIDADCQHDGIELAPENQTPTKDMTLYICGYPSDERNIRKLGTSIPFGGKSFVGMSVAAELITLPDGLLLAGMSGSPLFLGNGKVVGIASYARSYSQKLGGYAIPSATIAAYFGALLPRETTHATESWRAIALDMREVLRWLGYATQDGDGFFQTSYLNILTKRLETRVLENDRLFDSLHSAAFDAAVGAVQSLQQAMDNIDPGDYVAGEPKRMRPAAARGLFRETIPALTNALALLIGEGPDHRSQSDPRSLARRQRRVR
jgi:hypothetical protein